MSMVNYTSVKSKDYISRRVMAILSEIVVKMSEI